MNIPLVPPPRKPSSHKHVEMKPIDTRSLGRRLWDNGGWLLCIAGLALLYIGVIWLAFSTPSVPGCHETPEGLTVCPPMTSSSHP